MEKGVNEKMAEYMQEFTKEMIKPIQYNYHTIFYSMEKVGRHIVEWGPDELDTFLIGLDSISLNSLNKSLQYFREFHKFVCREEGIAYKQLNPPRNVFDYINLNKLLSVTLKVYQYQSIKNQLTVPYKGKIYNYRDKVLLILAWEGLSNEEIKSLKVDDIEFVNKDMIKIHLPERTVIIVNSYVNGIKENIVGDIKEAIAEQCYFREEIARNRKTLIPYRDTPYLIRPVKMRVSKKSEKVNNPSLILQNALKQIQMPGIDLKALSLRDIKRSKMIYLLAMDEDVRPSEIQQLWDKKTDTDIYWLKKVAKVIYGR